MVLGPRYSIGTVRQMTLGAEMGCNVFVDAGFLFPLFSGSPPNSKSCYGLDGDEKRKDRGLHLGPSASTTVPCPPPQLCGVLNLSEP